MSAGKKHKSHLPGSALHPPSSPSLMIHLASPTLSRAQLVSRSPHPCLHPSFSLACFSMSQSPMANCDHPPRSHNLLQTSEYLPCRPIQKLFFPLLNPPTLGPSASHSTHYATFHLVLKSSTALSSLLPLPEDRLLSPLGSPHNASQARGALECVVVAETKVCGPVSEFHRSHSKGRGELHAMNFQGSRDHTS